MPPDLRRVAEAKAWLDKAALDLRAAEHERTASPPLTGDMVFHAQQLVEKTLKAFLSWHDQPFRKTHSLVELGPAHVMRTRTDFPFSRSSTPSNLDQRLPS